MFSFFSVKIISPSNFKKVGPFSHLVFDKWNPNEIKCGLNSNVIFFMWATCVNFDCPSQSLRFLVLLFCLFLLLFLKSYFVFSLWSGYNTIIWWFFIYLFIYNFSWIWNKFSKEFLRSYEVLTNTSSRQLVTYVLYWVYHQSMSLLFTFNFFFPDSQKKKNFPNPFRRWFDFFFFWHQSWT